ncbi:MAG: hypothetical protein FJX30_06645, partial [Alphaproteobacteria bacterium]|nr:hypothetical protein [Alphaproteobacteria bacterium]
MENDSFIRRYKYKVVSKIITTPILMIMQAIIPRGLGPESYGQFTFLTNLFQQVFGFFDSGTSIGFYTKLSQNQKDRTIIRFYFILIFFLSLIVSVSTAAVYLFDVSALIFPGQKTLFVFLAIIYTILIWISESVYKIVDAYGLTVKGELILVIQKGGALLILSLIYFFGLINLFTFFIYNLLITLSLIFLWIFILSHNGVHLSNIPSLSFIELRQKLHFFWNYSSPLLVYSFVGMIVGVFDYWLLTKVSGSVQQGYFGLAFKLSSISFLFTAAMTQLITREFSIAHFEGDKKRIAKLYNNFVPRLYTIVAILAIFFVSHAETFTYLFGGDSFKGAALPIALMFLYPIHQTYGQLSGSLFFATGKTRQYRNIGICVMPISILLTWFLIGSNLYLGLGLGAIGLALKTLLLQFITVNVQVFYNLKYLALSFWKYLFHQIYVLITLLF